MVINDEIRNKIFESVDNLEKDLVNAVSDMVKIKSVNPNFDPTAKNENGETNVNKYTQKLMENMGLETDLFSIEEERHNLVGKYKGKGNGKKLLFNGHVDVVPPSDGAWEYEPFSGEIKNGYIHGRGSVDMKGGNAAALFALKAILDSGLQPQGDVIFQNVVGEENMETQKGTTACLKRGYIADAAICCEPTSTDDTIFQINTVSSGIFEMKWAVKGKACHSGHRGEVIRDGGKGEEIGVDAIEKGMIIYNALKDLERKWGQTKKHYMYKPGKFCLNAASIKAGTVSSFIPDHMEMVYSIWYPPQNSPDEIKEEIKDQIHNVCQNDLWLKNNPPEITWVFNWPAFDVSENEDICKIAQNSVKLVNQEAGEFTGMFAVCDASFIYEENIPVISLGPGNANYCHVVNEKLEIKNLIECTKIYALIIAEFCGISY